MQPSALVAPRSPGRSSGAKTRGNKRRPLTPEQEAKRAAVEERIKQLDEKVGSMTPEQYKSWLTSLPRLYRYSLGNYHLIRWAALEQGFEPTRVAPFKAWEKQGRKVQKGAKALPVLVPMVVPITERDRRTGEPRLDDNGQPVKRRVRIYKPKWAVFDITQTEPREGADGEPTPARDGAEQCVRDLLRVAERRTVPVFLGGVEDADFPQRSLLNAELLTNPNAGGYYIQGADGFEAIVTRKGLSPEEEARVLAHEVGHALLHRVTDGESNALSAHQKEVEAESVAFVLASDYGIATDFSAAYIQNWSADKSKKTKELQESSDRIRKAVGQIYDVLDGLDGGGDEGE
jgi:hypothetical protein